MLSTPKFIAKCIFIFVVLIPSTCFSGQLLRDATIVEVANTAHNNAEFAIRFSGGTGVCVDAEVIIFPEAKSQSPDSNQQLFALALAAFAAGYKVRVHNFENDNCNEANFIAITHD